MPPGAAERGARSRGLHTALEVATGLLVLLLLGWLGLSAWRFYSVYLLPEAQAIPTATPSPVPDPAAAREQARRLRLIIDHVGAGIAFRQAGQRERAVQEFRAALDLDPRNPEARQNLSEMGVLPPSAVTPSPAPTASVVPTVTPGF